LLCLLVFEDCDLIVLEAGLGGEYDATSAGDKDLSIITPIGIDHQAFLGDTIVEIATTKINSIQKQAIIASQPYAEVIDVAKEISQKRDAILYQVTDKYKEQISHIAKQKAWAKYISNNAMVACEALDIMGIDYDINDLMSLELFGRYYAYTPNIRIDVGHNSLAAQAIANSLDKKIVLIYNSLDDKDYTKVLTTLKPYIKRVQIIKIESQRAATIDEIEIVIKNLELEYSYFDGHIDESEDYLVFGSFLVVEKFLKIVDEVADGTK